MPAFGGSLRAWRLKASELPTSDSTAMELPDYHEKTYFTPFELEHILQIPLSDIVELFAKVPKVAQPRGCFVGEECRQVIAVLARKRVYADLIARSAVNAVPEIKRGEDSGEPHHIALRDLCHQRNFAVRFPGDLRLYLDGVIADNKVEQEKAAASEPAG